LVHLLTDNDCVIVVDCGSIGPFYNGFKEEVTTTYGSTINFLLVSLFTFYNILLIYEICRIFCWAKWWLV